MTRANDCVPHLHSHVSQCQRAGYANGRKDALEEIAVAVPEVLKAHSVRWSGIRGLYGCWCGEFGPRSMEDHRAHVTAAILAALSPTAAEQVSAALAVADKAAADTARALGDT